MEGSFLIGNWIIDQKEKPPENPYLLLGLPGIGNVAKISADYIIDKLKLKPFMVIYGKYMPHSVIINKDGTINLPAFYFYKFKNKDKKDVVIVTGESQPITEEATYEFAELVLKMFDYKIKEIVAFAGKGLWYVPEEPSISIVANDKKYLDSLIKKVQKINKNVKKDNSEHLSTITGLAGVLPAFSKIFNIKASTWMADTYGDPLFLGFNGAYVLIKTLKEYWKFDIDLKELEEEYNKIIEMIKKGENIIKKMWKESEKKERKKEESIKKYYYS